MRLLRKQGDVPKRSLWERIKDIAMMDVAVLARGGVSAGSLEQLEQLLLEADFGVPVTLRAEKKRVMVAAGDTFRAGAIDQLRVWAERTGAEFVSAQAGSDPGAVAFDAIDSAVARGVDVLIVDTAGRLHTSEGLMDELKKVARVITKRLPGAPHEPLLVLDGTIGQNAVQQAKIFSGAGPVSGLVVTKLDGTARGGVVIAVHEAIDVPVKFLSVGEGAADVVPFDAADFSEDLLSDE